MSEKLEGTVALITGGATGVGFALAQEAARRRIRIMIGDVNDADDAVAGLRQLGAEVFSLRADMTSPRDVDRLIEATIDRFGALNILCNNAGTGAAGKLVEVKPARARAILDLNVVGSLYIIRGAAPWLKKAADAGEPAFILNTGSEHALGVPPHVMPMSVYTVSKFATLGITETARRDFAGTGISVSMLAPGWVLTENIRHALDGNPAFAATVIPYAQEPDVVAKMAFDGMIEGRMIIITSEVTRAFAIERAKQLLSAVQDPLVQG
jgi:NAD(P)-dependent dehydrogenase (short-subunit alcohol dehydrogenase family)